MNVGKHIVLQSIWFLGCKIISDRKRAVWPDMTSPIGRLEQLRMAQVGRLFCMVIIIKKMLTFTRQFQDRLSLLSALDCVIELVFPFCSAFWDVFCTTGVVNWASVPIFVVHFEKCVYYRCCQSPPLLSGDQLIELLCSRQFTKSPSFPPWQWQNLVISWISPSKLSLGAAVNWVRCRGGG